MDIKGYIDDQRALGYTDDHIANELRKKGAGEDEIYDAFHKENSANYEGWACIILAVFSCY